MVKPRGGGDTSAGFLPQAGLVPPPARETLRKHFLTLFCPCSCGGPESRGALPPASLGGTVCAPSGCCPHHCQQPTLTACLGVCALASPCLPSLQLPGRGCAVSPVSTRRGVAHTEPRPGPPDRSGWLHIPTLLLLGLRQRFQGAGSGLGQEETECEAMALAEQCELRG